VYFILRVVCDADEIGSSGELIRLVERERKKTSVILGTELTV
jgi:quinolinate synthase